MRKLAFLIALTVAGMLGLGVAYAQTVISMTVPASVSQLTAFNQWCSYYLTIAPAVPSAAQQVQCVDTVVKRAVDAFGVASAASQVTAPAFNPN